MADEYLPSRLIKLGQGYRPSDEFPPVYDPPASSPSVDVGSVATSSVSKMVKEMEGLLLGKAMQNMAGPMWTPIDLKGKNIYFERIETSLVRRTVSGYSSAVHSTAPKKKRGKENKAKCDLCLHNFPKSSLRRLVSMKKLIDLREKWGLRLVGNRYQSAAFIYGDASLCVFCAQTFSVEGETVDEDLNRYDAKADNIGRLLHQTIVTDHRPPEDFTAKLENAAFLKPCRQSSTNDEILKSGFHRRFGPDLAVNGFAEEPCSSTKYEIRPWWEVDLEEITPIVAMKIWSRESTEQIDYAFRMVPCWIMISKTPFGQGGLENSCNKSVAKLQITHKQSMTAWKLPTPAYGRYVRIQLSEVNFLELRQVEVFREQKKSLPPPPPSIPLPRVDATSSIEGTEDLDNYSAPGDEAAEADGLTAASSSHLASTAAQDLKGRDPGRGLGRDKGGHSVDVFEELVRVTEEEENKVGVVHKHRAIALSRSQLGKIEETFQPEELQAIANIFVHLRDVDEGDLRIARFLKVLHYRSHHDEEVYALVRKSRFVRSILFSGLLPKLVKLFQINMPPLDAAGFIRGRTVDDSVDDPSIGYFSWGHFLIFVRKAASPCRECPCDTYAPDLSGSCSCPHGRTSHAVDTVRLADFIMEQGLALKKSGAGTDAVAVTGYGGARGPLASPRGGTNDGASSLVVDVGARAGLKSLGSSGRSLSHNGGGKATAGARPGGPLSSALGLGYVAAGDGIAAPLLRSQPTEARGGVIKEARRLVMLQGALEAVVGVGRTKSAAVVTADTFRSHRYRGALESISDKIDDAPGDLLKVASELTPAGRLLYLHHSRSTDSASALAGLSSRVSSPLVPSTATATALSLSLPLPLSASPLSALASGGGRAAVVGGRASTSTSAGRSSGGIGGLSLGASGLGASMPRLPVAPTPSPVVPRSPSRLLRPGSKPRVLADAGLSRTRGKATAATVTEVKAGASGGGALLSADADSFAATGAAGADPDTWNIDAASADAGDERSGSSDRLRPVAITANHRAKPRAATASGALALALARRARAASSKWAPRLPPVSAKFPEARCGLCGHVFPKPALERSVNVRMLYDLLGSWDVPAPKLEICIKSGISQYDTVPICAMCSQFFDKDFDSELSEMNGKFSGIKQPRPATRLKRSSRRRYGGPVPSDIEKWMFDPYFDARYPFTQADPRRLDPSYAEGGTVEHSLASDILPGGGQGRDARIISLVSHFGPIFRQSNCTGGRWLCLFRTMTLPCPACAAVKIQKLCRRVLAKMHLVKMRDSRLWDRILRTKGGPKSGVAFSIHDFIATLAAAASAPADRGGSSRGGVGLVSPSPSAGGGRSVAMDPPAVVGQGPGSTGDGGTSEAASSPSRMMRLS